MLFSLDRCTAAVAFDVHLEDCGVVNEPIDRGERHGGVREDPSPFSEGLVCGNEHGTALVAGADELEEHRGLGLVLGDVGDVIEDEQVVTFKCCDRRLEGEFTAGNLELLHQV